MAEEEYQIPIFFINGQLDSGKTRFITETIEMGQFAEAKNKLLIVCEEGEEEYDEKMLKDNGVSMVVLEKEDLTEEKLKELDKQYDPWIVIVEYNGMWDPDTILSVDMPRGWEIYQIVTMIDASTFAVYLNNMKSIIGNMIKCTELVIFNRCSEEQDLPMFRRNLKALNSNVQMMFEHKDGRMIELGKDIPPYDLNAPIIDITDDDYGIWYMDCQDEPQKYAGKTVKFLAQVCQTNRAGKNSFVPGRFAMTCCVQDIQFVGFPCSYDGCKALEQRAWVKVTAKVGYKFHNIYRGKGPVLTALSVEPAEKPLNDVVTFS